MLSHGVMKIDLWYKGLETEGDYFWLLRITCMLFMLLYIYIYRFSSEEVSAQNQVKASVQRRIRQSIAEEVLIFVSYLCWDILIMQLFIMYIVLYPCFFSWQYPGLEPVLDDLLPKKTPLIVVKWLYLI